MKVFIVGIKEGSFVLQADKKPIGTCPLDAESLTALFRKGKFRLKGQEEVLMHSSSVNHPEDSGAPKGFRAHEIIEQAVLGLTKKKPPREKTA